IEAWVIPGNVTQEDTSIISYSGLSNSRNFMLGQSLYNYEFYNRSSVAIDSATGGPALTTDDDDELAQATLQHVVMTFDPINGRQTYVNGEFSGVVDDQGGGNMGSWNDTFNLVFGNDASSTRAWSGIIRYAALHSRALTQEQIQQNFDVGVGVKYFLMFSISEVIDQEGVCHEGTGSSRVNHCYVVFEVSQLDEYAYVFNDPFFVTLNEDNFTLNNLNIKGIRVGVNGKLASTGQAFTQVDTTITSSNYIPGGVPLADIGTVIPLEVGATADMFFLAFDELSGSTGQVTPSVPAPTVTDYRASYGLSGSQTSDVAVRSFDAINQSFAQITGLSSTRTDIHNLFSGNPSDANDQGIKRQLPTIPDFQAYQAAHQTALAQLAIGYCNALVNDNTLRANFFNDGGSFDFNQRADLVLDNDWRDQVIYPLLDAVLIFDGANPLNIQTQPTRDNTRDTLLTLINNEADLAPYPYSTQAGDYVSAPDGNPDGLARCDGPGASFECATGRTEEVVKAVCAAVLGSAAVLLQ
ncbi:MAG: LamG domain-containing protein, partial [Spongiibacteraceae bacterium]|nr:LamG domain-containing protein [Spongiibacteraceae bacterium]